MPTLELNPKEAELLRETLELSATALLAEINHTDHREYRDELKERHSQLTALLGRIAMQLPSPLRPRPPGPPVL
jgi:hypothetical protein